MDKIKLHKLINVHKHNSKVEISDLRFSYWWLNLDLNKSTSVTNIIYDEINH